MYEQCYILSNQRKGDYWILKGFFNILNNHIALINMQLHFFFFVNWKGEFCIINQPKLLIQTRFVTFASHCFWNFCKCLGNRLYCIVPILFWQGTISMQP